MRTSMIGINVTSLLSSLPICRTRSLWQVELLALGCAFPNALHSIALPPSQIPTKQQMPVSPVYLASCAVQLWIMQPAGL